MLDLDPVLDLEGEARSGPRLAGPAGAKAGSFAGWFEWRAAATPDATALVTDEASLTFDQMNRAANRLAHCLRSLGAGPERVIAVSAGRSARTLLAVLGIWKAGGAFVPIEPGHPAGRIRHVLAETGALLLLADAAPGPAVAEVVSQAGVPLMVVGDEALADWPDADPEPLAGPDALAYCIYTSGTTGAPKGVAVGHRSLLGHARFMCGHLRLRPGDRFLHMTPLSIDAALEELLPTWIAGATVVLPGKLPMPGPALREALDAHRISVVSMASSLWHRWVDSETAGLADGRGPRDKPRDLRLVFIGGETAFGEKLRRWRALGWTGDVDWVMDYGPTEATITCATYRPPATVDDDIVPIGHPIDGAAIHLLDDRLDPVGDDTVGEIWIGGLPPARGYVKRPALTAEAFRPDPWGPPGSRMYRTGDHGLRSADGVLHFRGRRDEQVKILGHRVELGAIESCLVRCDGVREAAAALHDPTSADPLLVGYLVGEAPDPARVRAQLRDWLPQIMIPAELIVLDALPRAAAGGKLDRKRLPHPDSLRDRSTAGEPPRAAIARHWANVLGLPPGSDDDDFFLGGGDSLKAVQLIGRLRADLAVDLALADLFARPTPRGLAAAVDARRAEPDTRSAEVPDAAAAPAALRTGLAPASNGQRRLWFLSEYVKGSPAYSVPLGFRVRGAFAIADLDRALTALTARHEALRTALVMRDGRLMQEIAPPLQVGSKVLEADGWDAAMAMAEAEVRRPFDLGTPPLLRSLCIRYAPEAWLWVLNIHHAVCDAWSHGLLLRDLQAAWTGETAGPAAPQFADHVARFEALRASPAFDGHRSYWKRQLAGDLPVLALNHGAGTRRDLSDAGGVADLAMDAALAAQVQAAAAGHGTTVPVVLLSAFAATLHRWTLQDRIVIGVPAACRMLPADQATVGYFANTLPIVVDAGRQRSFGDLVAHVAGRLSEALAHQELPFDEIVDLLDLPGRSSRNPLFQAMFVMQSTPADFGFAPPGARLEEVLVHTGTAKVDLSCMLRLTEGTVRGELEYATDVLDAAEADLLRGHFLGLLRAATRAPNRPLDTLALGTGAERDARLRAINADHAVYPDLRPIHRYIEEQADRTPDAIAVETLSERITYGELDARANRLANALAAAGIGPEDLVGVCLDRSLALIVALLGVLKAGAGFVPLSPGYPLARTRKILLDAGVSHLIVDAANRDRLALPGVRLWSEDRLDPTVGATRGSVPARPDHLACAYYTSGSTGEPKGVLLDHRCVMGRIAWLRDRYPLREGDRVLHKTPLVFDVAIWEIFGPLMSGATVLAADPGGEADVDHIRALLARPGTVFAHFVPSMLDAVLSAGGWDEAPDLKWVQVSGEGLSADLLARYRARVPIPLHNCYGQTETSEVAYWQDDARGYRPWAPIGRQIGLYRIFLLDRSLQPVEPGMPGEICVAGVGGLARGYRGGAGLTAEKFVPHPWPIEPGERLYRTGDLGRVTSTGALEYLGRLDEQVKIRGCRVEIAEVEQVLRGLRGVAACAVIARRDASGSDRLIAYVQGDGLTPAGLGAQAEFLLPPYMLPAAYVVLDRLPLTASGKLDRLSLPPPGPDHFASRGGSAPPASPLEDEIAAVWREVLTLPAVGRRDAFFAIGGNSLTAIQVIARLKARFGVRISVRDFFAEPTVEGLAGLVEAGLIDRVAALSEDEARQMLEGLRS